MTRSALDEAVEAAVSELSATRDDALFKAQGEGFPDRREVVAWRERAKLAVLHLRDRSALRSQIPYLARRRQKGGARAEILPAPGASDPDLERRVQEELDGA